MNAPLFRSRMIAIVLIFAILIFAFPVDAAPPPTYWEVTNTNDSGTGSLRWAMTNSNSDGNASRITFNIDASTDPGCISPAGPCTIQPSSALPFLNDTDTEINGYSQPGAEQAVGSGTALIKIIIDGTSVAGNNGFNVTTANNVIKGLAIHSFGLYGVAIYNPAADDNIIEGNHIGTAATGLSCLGNGTPGTIPLGGGILIENGAENNIIGGSTAAERNIIACNEANGIDISDLSNSDTTTGNQVLGNYIGDWSLDPTDQGNDGTGVFIGHGAFGNSIGDGTAAGRNVINGNGGDGIGIYGPNSTLNTVLGNYIGVNGDASTAVANDLNGVRLYGGAHDNTIGGATEFERNIISGNTESGIRIAGATTHTNTILGNYIGTNGTGTSAISNIDAGVLITDSSYNNTVGPGNVISGNYAYGVHLTLGATTNTITGNLIGTNPAGTGQLSNDTGVFIDGAATSNTIGGTSPADQNIISGNDHEGVLIEGAGTNGNTVIGNAIGTDITGTLSIPNNYGVTLRDGPQFNVVGEAGSGNTISGNYYQGLVITGSSTPVTDNTVAANVIGLNQAGTSALGNGMAGITLFNGSQDNTIGGNAAGDGNVVSGNSQEGIVLGGANTTGNTITGNLVGTDSSGTSAIPNARDGLRIDSDAHHNTVGGDTAQERNLLSGNTWYGIRLNGSSTTQNAVSGNFIGINLTGSGALPNGNGGVRLEAGAHTNTIGGSNPGEGNVISGNSGTGVYLEGSGTDSNVIKGNIIGLDPSANVEFGNVHHGVAIVSGPQGNVIGGSSAGDRNIISGNTEDGVYLSDTSSNTFEGNIIGTNTQGSAAIGNNNYGVYMQNGAVDNTIGPGNRIAFNGFHGIYATGDTTEGNVFTQNSIFGNLGGGIGLWYGAHNSILAPVISSTTMSSVTISGGSSCPTCTVEVFSNLVNERQGRTYLGSTTADGSGDWSLTVPCISGEYLTATATDATDGTSEFSSVFTSTVKCTFLPLIMR